MLCGGLGTRFAGGFERSAQIDGTGGGVPFLQLLLENLKAQGVEKVLLGTDYLAEQIESFFGAGDALGLRLLYSREYEPLGTGDALKLAEPRLSDPIVVLNGDSYVDGT